MDLAEERDKGVDGELSAFRHHVLKQPIQQLRSVLDARVTVGAHPA